MVDPASFEQAKLSEIQSKYAPKIAPTLSGERVLNPVYEAQYKEQISKIQDRPDITPFLQQVAAGQQAPQTVKIEYYSRPHPRDPATIIVGYKAVSDSPAAGQSTYTSGETQVPKNSDYKKDLEQFAVEGARNYFRLGKEATIVAGGEVLQKSALSPSELSAAREVYAGRKEALSQYERAQEQRQQELKAGMLGSPTAQWESVGAFSKAFQEQFGRMPTAQEQQFVRTPESIEQQALKAQMLKSPTAVFASKEFIGAELGKARAFDTGFVAPEAFSVLPPEMRVPGAVQEKILAGEKLTSTEFAALPKSVQAQLAPKPREAGYHATAARPEGLGVPREFTAMPTDINPATGKPYTEAESTEKILSELGKERYESLSPSEKALAILGGTIHDPFGIGATYIQSKFEKIFPSFKGVEIPIISKEYKFYTDFSPPFSLESATIGTGKEAKTYKYMPSEPLTPREQFYSGLYKTFDWGAQRKEGMELVKASARFAVTSDVPIILASTYGVGALWGAGSRGIISLGLLSEAKTQAVNKLLGYGFIGVAGAETGLEAARGEVGKAAAIGGLFGAGWKYAGAGYGTGYGVKIPTFEEASGIKSLREVVPKVEPTTRSESFAATREIFGRITEKPTTRMESVKASRETLRDIKTQISKEIAKPTRGEEAISALGLSEPTIRTEALGAARESVSDIGVGVKKELLQTTSREESISSVKELFGNLELGIERKVRYELEKPTRGKEAIEATKGIVSEFEKLPSTTTKKISPLVSPYKFKTESIFEKTPIEKTSLSEKRNIIQKLKSNVDLTQTEWKEILTPVYEKMGIDITKIDFIFGKTKELEKFGLKKDDFGAVQYKSPEALGIKKDIVFVNTESDIFGIPGTSAHEVGHIVDTSGVVSEPISYKYEIEFIKEFNKMYGTNIKPKLSKLSENMHEKIKDYEISKTKQIDIKPEYKIKTPYTLEPEKSKISERLFEGVKLAEPTPSEEAVRLKELSRKAMIPGKERTFANVYDLGARGKFIEGLTKRAGAPEATYGKEGLSKYEKKLLKTSREAGISEKIVIKPPTVEAKISPYQFKTGEIFAKNPVEEVREKIIREPIKEPMPDIFEGVKLAQPTPPEEAARLKTATKKAIIVKKERDFSDVYNLGIRGKFIEGLIKSSGVPEATYGKEGLSSYEKGLLKTAKKAGIVEKKIVEVKKSPYEFSIENLFGRKIEVKPETQKMSPADVIEANLRAFRARQAAKQPETPRLTSEAKQLDNVISSGGEKERVRPEKILGGEREKIREKPEVIKESEKKERIFFAPSPYAFAPSKIVEITKSKKEQEKVKEREKVKEISLEKSLEKVLSEERTTEKTTEKTKEREITSEKVKEKEREREREKEREKVKEVEKQKEREKERERERERELEEERQRQRKLLLGKEYKEEGKPKPKTTIEDLTKYRFRASPIFGGAEKLFENGKYPQNLRPWQDRFWNENLQSEIPIDVVVMNKDAEKVVVKKEKPKMKVGYKTRISPIFESRTFVESPLKPLYEAPRKHQVKRTKPVRVIQPKFEVNLENIGFGENPINSKLKTKKSKQNKFWEIKI